MKKNLLLILITVVGFIKTYSQIIIENETANSFSLNNAVIYTDSNDFALIKKSAELLQADIEMVIGKKLPIKTSLDKPYKNIIALGSIEKSSLLKELIAKKKLTTASIKNKWPPTGLGWIHDARNDVAGGSVCDHGGVCEYGGRRAHAGSVHE